MKQEVILDFLNLPGIAGVALMDKRSRPFFCGIDQTLNFQQKEALTQGILQVFETIPDEFESFGFYFSGYQVYIYKLARGIILLILAQENLVYSDYLKTIKNLKAILKEDLAGAIATFRLTAGSATLPGISLTRRTISQSTEAITRVPAATSPPSVPANNVSPPVSHPSEIPVATPARAATSPPSVPVAKGDRASNGVVPKRGIKTDHGITPINLASGDRESPDQRIIEVVESSTLGATLGDAIAALNQLSQFTTQYLGTHVITNYWKATRPNEDWLSPIQIDRTAQFSLTTTAGPHLQTPLTLEQQTALQAWVAHFIKRGSQVIRDFPNLIQQKALTDEQKKLLLG